MGFKLDTREFDATLRRYRELHRRRTVPEIVNKKALYIARGASQLTPKPSTDAIKKAIGRELFGMEHTQSGRGKRVLNIGKNGAPVGALIINFLRGQKGLRGLYGAEMKDAINRLVGSRIRARAFLAAGWIPAIKKLSALVSNKSRIPKADRDAEKIKNPKGSVRPATRDGWKSVATIINEAVSHFTTTKDPLGKIAEPALIQAIENERRSMLVDIENQMRKDAHEVGIKTN